MQARVPGNVRGFSLIELLLVVAVAATLMAIAIPVLTDVTDSTKLNTESQLVERELQKTRLRAVATNSVLRLRTNCPSAGYYRIVEVLGTAADAPAARCDASTYPYKPQAADLAVPPNFDGVLKQLLYSATVTDVSLEFRPDGTAWDASSGTPAAIAPAVTVTVTRNGKTKSITVNALGKILLQ